VNILSHLKFFDPHLDDNDKQNVYMAREWRVMRQVRFRLVDVTRIMLPERFARRFRRDVSRYDGRSCVRTNSASGRRPCLHGSHRLFSKPKPRRISASPNAKAETRDGRGVLLVALAIGFSSNSRTSPRSRAPRCRPSRSAPSVVATTAGGESSKLQIQLLQPGSRTIRGPSKRSDSIYSALSPRIADAIRPCTELPKVPSKAKCG
jgi:hypothetical protein